MNFLHKNKTAINIAFVLAIVINIVIGFLINIISQERFNLLSGKNILLYAILGICIIIYIVCQILTHAGSSSSKKRLQKAFRDNGGYEAIVDEMKECIKNHDYKSAKNLKKIADMLEN